MISYRVDGGGAVEDEPAAGELVQLLEVGAPHEVLLDVAGGVLQIHTGKYGGMQY